ncbi:MAG: hypothetical protein R3D25_02870 [Geminicoccaceae bacterium]
MTANRRLFSLKQRPSTYAEAGVVAPFTTPLLLQARLRLDYRSRLEVVARNPTGADGVYVVPLASLEEFFRLSLHDRALIERLRGLTPIGPLGIREIALGLASEGLAGPDAEAAATRSLQEDRSLLTMLLLLEQLLQEPASTRSTGRRSTPPRAMPANACAPISKSLEPSMGIGSNGDHDARRAERAESRRSGTRKPLQEPRRHDARRGGRAPALDRRVGAGASATTMPSWPASSSNARP